MSEKAYDRIVAGLGEALCGGRARRILVCGGRDFHDYDLVCTTLDGLFRRSVKDGTTTSPPPSDTVIIHGDAPGADRFADQWAA